MLNRVLFYALFEKCLISCTESYCYFERTIVRYEGCVRKHRIIIYNNVSQCSMLRQHFFTSAFSLISCFYMNYRAVIHDCMVNVTIYRMLCVRT